MIILLRLPCRNARVDHDGGFGASGLRRIRRAPSSRAPTFIIEDEDLSMGGLLRASTLPVSGASSRSASRTRDPTSASRSASTAQYLVSGATSPVIEDLQRFPTESLHSFSFARQSEDFLHSRHAIIQKSLDLVRDFKGLRTNVGLAHAQAKVNGNEELQGMIDLLRRANVVPSANVKATHTLGLGLGPMTGPANFEGRNIFDQSFRTASEGAENDISPSNEKLSELLISSRNEDVIIEEPEESAVQDESGSPIPRRIPLKRTYTDIKEASLNRKLHETLAKPYTSDGAPLAQGSGAVSFLAGAEAPKFTASQPIHTHTTKWTPPAQAFFRTDSDTPWTIVAANDLACLTFGVTRAEVRSLSILGLIQHERRHWLEGKLRVTESIIDPPKSPEVAHSPEGRLSNLATKGGITARLLSKAPSRLVKIERAQTDIGPGGLNRPAPRNHTPRKSRGVILCGEILPIQKRNGTIGAASFWVMEKRGGLIWVVEEVIEDVAFLGYDSSRRLSDSRGDAEQIWGESLRSGTKLRYLLPKLSFEDMDDPAFDGQPILGHYTASTIGGVNVPTCVAKVKGKNELRVSSLPNIAGVMVLDADTLKINSSNTIFSQALFGHSRPNGMFIDELIMNFSQIVDFLAEDNDDFLAEGLVIPEHSFRKARAMLSFRNGAEDAASIFLRPSGLPAKHRDGSDIMVDVQLRVVRSGTVFPTGEDVILEEGSEDGVQQQVGMSELVYALWITYSRQLHSAGMGVVRPEHPLMSRPTTPPPQPPPLESLPSPPQVPETFQPLDVPSSRRTSNDATSTVEPLEHPPPHIPYVAHPKKTIKDFIILEEMGSGAYGDVKLARYQNTRSNKVVIKYVTKRKILVDTWIRDRRLGTTPLEIHVLDFLRRDGYRHPNIVEMVDFFEDDMHYYIEMVPHGLPGMDLFVSVDLSCFMPHLLTLPRTTSSCV